MRSASRLVTPTRDSAPRGSCWRSGSRRRRARCSTRRAIPRPSTRRACCWAVRASAGAGNLPYVRGALARSKESPQLRGAVAAAGASGVRDLRGAAAAFDLLIEWEEEGLIDFARPSDGPALAAMVRAASTPESRTQALARLRLAIEASPDAAGLHALLGGLLAQDPGARREALAAHERALSLDPSLPSALKGRAELLTQRDPERGVALWSAAAEAAPHDPEIARAYAAVLRGAARIEEAQEVLEASSSLHPLDGALLAELASVRLARGQLDASTLALAQRAARFVPTQENRDLLAAVRAEIEATAAN